ncbi:WSC domain-containing protein [Fusarium pseudocircinatum]|uniref:WSC domain-containing protein n=1 Tax=Fusarium pseudocircinatum TaxID=56676 RepID=A0A8H5LDP7_9HYPO|nr:WSC domain-containing protein [Fusarium pseudocircinatum]
MIASTLVLFCAAAAVGAIPAQSFDAEILRARAVVTSTDGICGAFNGSASCLGTGFGNCCSQFGYCGTSDLHCNTGCQTGFGSCGTQSGPEYKDLGCFVDSTSARVLPTLISHAGNTPTKCKAACANGGFAYAGLEFGSQCWCGSAPQQDLVPSQNCNIACPGDITLTCGGSNAIELFATVPTWMHLGCYSDTTLSRTLSNSLNVAGNTNKKCQDACAAAGYKYAGTEFGNQCFCGNTIDNSGAPIAASTCNKACAGDSTATCGGPNALSLFYLL